MNGKCGCRESLRSIVLGRNSLFLEILALYFWKGLGRSLPEHVHGTFGLDLRGYSGPVVSSVGGGGVVVIWVFARLKGLGWLEV